MTESKTTAPQLSDEAWEFIRQSGEHRASQESPFVTFEGDWGNWNWLFSEIWKRCQPKDVTFEEALTAKLAVELATQRQKDIRHRCSCCLRDFSSHGSCIVHIGNYHSQGGCGEYDPKAHAIPKEDANV